MSEELNHLKEKIKNQSKKKIPKNQRPIFDFLLKRQERRLGFLQKLLFIQRRVQPYDISIDYSASDQTKIIGRKDRRLSYIG